MNDNEFLDAYKEHMDMISKALENLAKRVQTIEGAMGCLLYTSPSPRDLSTSRMPSSA